MRTITFDGRTLSLAAWADEADLEYGTLYQRIRAGWSPRRALTTPSHRTLRGGLPGYQTGPGVDVSRYPRGESP